MFVYDDNFLTEAEIQEIEDSFNSSNNTWQYLTCTVYLPNMKHNTVVMSDKYSDTQYFTFKPSRDNFNTIDQYRLTKKLINKFTKKNNISYSEIERIKFNITPLSNDDIITTPHVDRGEPHYIFLYYVNDAEGDTILFNETFNGEIIDDLSIMTEIKPKRGSAFIVNGDHFHAWRVPKNGDLRKVINANLIV